MNPLYDPLPESVDVRGKQYRIITDFRDWIRMTDMLAEPDTEIGQIEKANIALQWFLDRPPVGQAEDAVKALFDFMWMRPMLLPFDEKRLERTIQPKSGTDEEPSGAPKQPTFSYQYDAGYIASAFLQCYGIDLFEIDYMHWWKFKFLLDGLPDETQLRKRMYHRGIDVSKIKDKAERKRIVSIQEEIALPHEIVSDADIGEAFW